jgi:preprotein translocase SecE subunit
MENQNQKWVNLSFFVFSALLFYVLSSLIWMLSGTYDLEARVPNLGWTIRAVAFAVSAVVFLLLYKNEKANEYMNEVFVELSRVTWPSQKETQRSTVLVMIMVALSGAFLGFLDSIWSWAVSFIL